MISGRRRLKSYKEKNTYREDNPYILKREQNPYHKKTPYIKKKDALVDRNVDIKIADPNTECSTYTESDRSRLKNIPIRKDNPYVNWKFSAVKDIDPNHEAKCLKTNYDGQNIQIDSFAVTPKPVNNDYLNELDWMLNEEFIDAVRIEQEGIDDANEAKNKQTNVDIECNDKHDEFNKNETEESGVTCTDDPISSYSYDESEELKEAIEIVAKATVIEHDNPIVSDQNIITDASNVDQISNTPNFNKKIEALKDQLYLLFEHQKFEESNQINKEVVITDDLKNSQTSESKENIKQTIENAKIDQKNKKATVEDNLDAKESDKLLHSVKSQFVTTNEKKVEQQGPQITVSQSKAKEKYPSQLNIRFHGKIDFDPSIITKAIKLPDNVPTFILIGDRFVREDKVLIDLDTSDLAPKDNSSSIIKPSLPPELQGIDYEGWYMQQIVEEFKNNLKTNGKIKANSIESLLKEFDLI